MFIKYTVDWASRSAQVVTTPTPPTQTTAQERMRLAMLGRQEDRWFKLGLFRVKALRLKHHG